ncbi:MAG: adenine phosphoribosyltransferase [bacterium]|nr:MAG: adenine phosphoribosyltransferase [bacterium]
MDLKKLVRDVADFPKEGILFKDLTTLWKDQDGFKESIDQLAKKYQGAGIDKVVGMEARGFIVGAPVAYLIGAGFVPVRKPGKLPSKTVSETYDLEYGTDTLVVHEDAINKGDKVLIVDDLLATGGTAEATVKLIEKLGGEVFEVCCLVELGFLNGRSKVSRPVFALLKY